MSGLRKMRAHGGVRGNNLSRSSILFGGPYGRIFRALPPADFGNDDAASLRIAATCVRNATTAAS